MFSKVRVLNEILGLVNVGNVECVERQGIAEFYHS